MYFLIVVLAVIGHATAEFDHDKNIDCLIVEISPLFDNYSQTIEPFFDEQWPAESRLSIKNDLDNVTVGHFDVFLETLEEYRTALYKCDERFNDPFVHLDCLSRVHDFHVKTFDVIINSLKADSERKVDEASKQINKGELLKAFQRLNGRAIGEFKTSILAARVDCVFATGNQLKK